MKKNSVIGYKKGQMVTVGIPTCYGGDSLVETVRTLSQSEKVDKFRLIIVADRNPISKSNLKKLTDLGAEIYWNKKEGSQFKKLRQIVEMVESELFVFTNDDIVFETNTIAEIVKVFQKNPRAGLVGVKILPLKPQNLFEAVMGIEVKLANRVGEIWNKQDNHLLASGRCFAFRSSLIKKARLPENVVNGDTFLYFENKRLGQAFKYANKSKAYIRCPQSLEEQLWPSSRFQYSKEELQSYFQNDLSKLYKVPVLGMLRSLVVELVCHPILTLLYILVYFYTRLNKKPREAALNTIWATSPTTKKLDVTYGGEV